MEGRENPCSSLYRMPNVTDTPSKAVSLSFFSFKVQPRLNLHEYDLQFCALKSSFDHLHMPTLYWRQVMPRKDGWAPPVICLFFNSR